MLHNMWLFIKETGVYGALVIAVVVIGYLIYSIFKITQANKTQKELNEEFKKKSKSVTEILKKIVEELGINRKTILNKIEKLDNEISKVDEHLNEIDKTLIINKADQKIIISNMDRIVNTVMDMTVDLRGLVNYTLKKNGNGNGK